MLPRTMNAVSHHHCRTGAERAILVARPLAYTRGRSRETDPVFRTAAPVGNPDESPSERLGQ